MANNRELSQFANTIGYNGGNIGIGTDNPGTKLDVRGGNWANGDIIVGKIDNAGRIKFRRGADGSDTGSIGFSAADSNSVLSMNVASGDGTLTFQTNSVEKLRITSDGKLILSGTQRTTPFISGDGGMCIEQSYDGNLRALTIRNKDTDAAAATSLAFSLNRSGGDYDFVGGEIKLVKEQTWTTTDSTIDSAMIFSTGANNSLTEKLRIASDGKIAIGGNYGDTSTFGRQLLISGTVALNNDSGNIGMGFNRGSSNTYGYIGTGSWAINALSNDDFGISSGSTGDLAFGTGAGTERLRITSDGHKFTNNGSIFHGNNDITAFTDASRGSLNNVSLRAGHQNDGTTPTNNNSAVKIYPAGVRSGTVGNLTGGIAWQHLDPNNGDWGTNFGAGAQIWMGAALHDTPGQERDRFNLWMNSSTTGNSNPNQLAIEAYPNGVVRHPKVPAFHVVGGTVLVNSTYTVIVSGTSQFNNGGHYNTSNGRFTAPVDGYYHFSFWGLIYPHASGVMTIRYQKNGSIYGNQVQGGADGQSHTSRSGTIIMDMVAGDYAELTINRGSQTGVNAYGSQWNMSGFLVG